MTISEKVKRNLGYSDLTGLDEAGLMFRPQIFFAPDDGGSGGSGGSDDNGGDDDNNDSGSDNDNNDNQDNNNGTDVEAIKAEMEKEHKKELDRYRNDIGQLKKQLKEIQEKGMSEEEKLEARAKELQDKEQELRVKELDAHKSQQIAEQELDKRLADYIQVNAEASEEDITGSINKLKTAVDAIVQETIEKMQEGSSVINGFNIDGNKNNKKSSVGEQLAKINKENNKGAEEAQKNYFK